MSNQEPTTPEEARKLLIKPETGDLTPEYCQWLQKNAHLHEIDSIYAGRKELFDKACGGKELTGGEGGSVNPAGDPQFLPHADFHPQDETPSEEEKRPEAQTSPDGTGN